MSLGKVSLAFVALLFSGQAASHMVMRHPFPFDKGLDTTPLINAKPGSAGSDYPCKQRPGVYDVGEHGVNNMKVASPIALTFNGSASHGGGTCQIAISLDEKPDFTSVWKVIHVYEGGCPTGKDGNSNNFTFQIPTGFPDGRATLSWTWYNKIGNREVYQNCAPIDVTGGSGSEDVFESLPNLYLINLPTSECSTVETTDLEIPNPGQSILRNSSIIRGATGPSCAASAAAQTASTVGYQTESPNGNGSSSHAGSATTPGYGGAASSASKNDGSYAAPTIMMTIASSAASASQSSAAADAPVLYPTLTPSACAGISGAASASNSASAPSGTGSSYGGTSCTTDGAVVCNGSSQFGLRDHGKVLFQAVADGTTCSNGQIQKRNTGHHAHARRHVKGGGRLI